MHHFLEIISEPDNIAILLMLISTIACCAGAFREIRMNDRLIRDGKKEEIYERMTR